MELLTPDEAERSFTIHFSGPNVDSDGMPVGELLISLDGWSHFLELAFTLHVRGTLTTTPLAPDQGVRLHIKRLGPGGSIIAVLTVVGGLVLGTIVQEETKRTWPVIRAKTWQLATRLYRALVIEKRDHRSLVDAAATIEQVAALEGVVIDIESDPVAVAAELDQVLSRATLPLDSAVSEISVAAPGTAGEVLDVRRSDRAALAAPFAPEPPPVDADLAVEASVEFVKVDRKNGTGSIKFTHPQSDDQRGVRPCRIADCVGLASSRDPYTGSLHCKKPVKLWVRRAITNAETGRFRWEVSQNPPAINTELFDSASGSL